MTDRHGDIERLLRQSFESEAGKLGDAAFTTRTLTQLNQQKHLRRKLMLAFTLAIALAGLLLLLWLAPAVSIAVFASFKSGAGVTGSLTALGITAAMILWIVASE